MMQEQRSVNVEQYECMKGHQTDAGGKVRNIKLYPHIEAFITGLGEKRRWLWDQFHLGSR